VETDRLTEPRGRSTVTDLQGNRKLGSHSGSQTSHPPSYNRGRTRSTDCGS